MGEEDYNDRKGRLLDVLFPKKNDFEIFNSFSKHHKIVIKDILDSVHVYILSSIGKPIPFQFGPLNVILEFNRRT